MKYGYARVSSKDQKLEDQIELLTKSGCDMVRSEKVSGRNVNDRPELQVLLTFMRAGDELWVTRIDRLARSVLDLCNIVKQLRDKGCQLKAVQQSIDTSTAAGAAFLSMLGVFAEFENEIRRERQMAGIARAKAEGKYVGKGRPATIDYTTIKALHARGLGATDIAKKLRVSRASVYRALDAAESPS